MITEKKTQAVDAKQEKKTNKKIYVKFALILGGSFLVGLLIGMCANFLSDKVAGMQSVWDNMITALRYAVPVFWTVLNLGAFIASLLIYQKAKRLEALWDGEDEGVIERIENLLSYPSLLSSVMMVCNFAFFGIMIKLVELNAGAESPHGALTGIILFIFIMSFVLETIVSKLVVDFEKKLNPEKRGNIFDTGFNQIWLGSCDEAEKHIIYQSGYGAFRAGNMTCMVLWVITMFSQMFFQTGVLPVICVCIIWLVLVISYMVNVMKLEKH